MLPPPAHLVQFYNADEPLLTRNVTDYLLEGLNQGDALLVIATPERIGAVARELRESGADPEAAIRQRRLLFADAEQTLSRFMVNGQPEWQRFERTVRALIKEVGPQPDHNGLRAYGEMVGVLWKTREFSAAVRLEHFWNRLMSAHSFQLFCAYPIDVFGKDFHSGALDSLLCAHTHLLPATRNRDLDSAMDRAMDEILGANAPGLRSLINANYRPSWAEMPEAEAVILWLRQNLPACAEEIVARARQYFQAGPGSELPVYENVQ